MTLPNAASPRLRLRLALDPLFWSAGLAHYALRTAIRWERVAWVGRPVEDRLRYAFADATRTAYQSFFWAVAATLIAWLLVRLVVGPLVRLWIAPPPSLSGGEAVPREFLLEPGESVDFERPARILIDGTWRAGALALTDRRIRFFPIDPGVAPWSIDRTEVADLALVAVPARLAAVVSGWPDRLAIVDRSSSSVLAGLLDPAEFADRFRSVPFE